MPAPLAPSLRVHVPAGSERRRDVLWLAAAALLVRVPVLLSSVHLGFDDGVYGASAIAMRRGGAPFRDVFSSQGPLFLPVVYVFDLLGLRTLDAPRLAAVAGGVAATLAVYFAGRATTDRGGALLAAGLVATSGCLLWTTGPLTSDGVAEAYGVCAVAVALGYRRTPSTARAVVIGLLAGAAVATKSLLVGPAVLTAWLVVLVSRRWRHVVLVPVLAAAVLLVASLPWGLHDVYEQSVRYHLDKTGDRRPVANARKTATTLGDRDLPLLLAGALALGFGLAALTRRKSRPRDAEAGTGTDPWPIVVWLVLAVFVVLLQDPMWRNHIAHVIPPAALLVGIYRPPWRALVVAGLVAVPWWAVHLWPLLRPGGYEGRPAVVERALRRLPPGAGAISDEPGLVWRAGRAIPPNLVDASRLRIEADSPGLRITPRTVLDAAQRRDVCAVVVWSERWSGTRRDHVRLDPPVAARYAAFDALPALLRDAGYVVARHWDDEHVLYVKTACAPDDRALAGTAPRRSLD